MDVEKYAELCIRSLGENTDSKIDERDALGLADIIRAQILEAQLQTGGSLTGEYLLHFNQPIIWDEKREMWYFYKPCDLLNLEGNRAWVSVGTGDIESSWIAMNWADVAAYNRLEAGQMGGRTIFIPTNDKVFLRYPPVSAPCDVEMWLLPSLLWVFDNREDSDLVGNASLEGKTFDLVIERLKMREQKVMFNDNQQYK